ncbi:PP2C family protein-serine/threonine phosphatase [Streptomyces gobiensis]|uniref:PP2C family protein-serine/threonine phosphatase n=1 Tax=Streptomyces gobiensis TaxID=2875706 RepID=UPI001E341027|nr:protein phosphatase 2C domain-containing protein [Streptomyces gobiensis]UGY91826.1 protein phosphatase 2C domain-containing protein [Streptomyces gobiensis]
MAYVAVSALSQAGMVRAHNEDSLVIGPWTLCGTETESPQTLLFPLGTPLVVAVADGLGGHPGGEVASALVVRRLAKVGPLLNDETAVRAVVDACNEAVYSAAADNPKLIMMGTTIAGVVVLSEEILTFNVGDSRVFEVTGGLRQTSVDDSPPLAPGERTTSVVTQTLGGSSEYTAVEAHVSSRPLALGDRYLVCSDGLTDPVPDKEIDDVLRLHDGGKAAFELWKAAMDAGGPDNITIALVRVADEVE